MGGQDAWAGRAPLRAVGQGEEGDQRFIAALSRAAAAPVSGEELVRLRDAPLPPSLDYSEHVSLIYDQVGGGCGSATLLGILNIQNERVCRYSPDLSLRYLNYVFNETEFFHRDQRFARAGIAQDGALVFYGCCSETTWPSNAFVWPDSGPPPDGARDEATQFRLDALKPEGSPNIGCMALPDVEPLTLKQALVSHGPLMAKSPTHVFAIIGYDDPSGTFTLLNSWGDGWGSGGMCQVPYDEIANPTQLGSTFAVESAFYVQNHADLAGPQFTGRVKIRHFSGRRHLVVKVSAEGQDPVVVWDYREHDRCSNLSFDFPLPGYASEHWPPAAAGGWHVAVCDSSPGSPTQAAAVIEEVTLAERVKGPEGAWTVTPYQASASGFPVGHGGTITVDVLW